MLTINRLLWDTWNVAHIARHQVLPDEVVEVCEGDFSERLTYGGRFLLVGPTRHGRMCAVVLESTEQANVFYPVTARPASRKERHAWAATRHGYLP